MQDGRDGRALAPENNDETLCFLKEVAVSLDDTLNILRQREEELTRHLGVDRVAELRELRALAQRHVGECCELLSRATHRERTLLQLWNRLERLGELRATAGRDAIVMCSVVGGDNSGPRFGGAGGQQT